MDELPFFLGSLEFIGHKIVRYVRAGYCVSVRAFRVQRRFLHGKALGRVCVLIKNFRKATIQFRSVRDVGSAIGHSNRKS